MMPLQVPVIGDRQPIIRILIQNGGREEAIVSGGNISTKITKGPLPAKPDYAPVSASFRTIIPANTTFASTLRLNDNGKPAIIETPSANAINSGDAKWWIFGYITYEDRFSIFGPTTTGFCEVYDPLNDPAKDAMFDSCGSDAFNYIYRR
jgi:hypothetical protein